MRRDVSNNNELALYKISADGKAERKIVSLGVDENSTKISGINISINQPYKKRAFYSIINENGLLYADNTNYQVVSYDEDGTMKESISIKQKAEKVSNEERNAIEKIVNNTKISGVQIKITPNIPENRPFISGLLTDEKGRIYVIRKKSIIDDDIQEEIDIIGKDGLYLYKVKIPVFPKVIKEGMIYAIIQNNNDDEGKSKIIILKINNYNLIKDEFE